MIGVLLTKKLIKVGVSWSGTEMIVTIFYIRLSEGNKFW